MRIALIVSGCRPGLDGVTTAVHERCLRLSKWGHQVLVIGPDYAPVAGYFPDWQAYLGEFLPGVTGVTVPCAALFGLEWERNPVRAANPHLDRYLDAFRPDIIHVDEPERLAVGYHRRPGLRYARDHAIPAVAFYHTNFIDYANDFLKPAPRPVIRVVQRIAIPLLAAAYNGYDATLVSSATTCAKIRDYGIRNTVLGAFNGVDTARFAPVARDADFFTRAYGLPPLGERIKILIVGRLTPDKGWAFANKALPALAQAVGAERLAVIIAGGGELEGEIRQALGGALPHVHLLGRVPSDRMADLYAQSDIYLSTSQRESQGLAALEAAAAGVPVVVPRAGGFMDFVRDGENGRMFQPDDIDDFIRVLQPLCADPALRQRMGESGRRAVAPLDWDVTIRNWLDAVAAQRPRAG